MPESVIVPAEALQAQEEEIKPQISSYDINKFKLTKVLSNNTSRKMIALLGTFPEVSATDEAVLLFEKQPFAEDDVQTDNKPTVDVESTNGTNKLSLFSKNFTIKTELLNDIYGNFQCNPDDNLNCKINILLT